MLIGKTYELVSDRLDVTLKEKRFNPKTGNESWANVAYFSKLESALKYLVDHHVKKSELKDLKTVIDEINKLKKLITAAL